jgi:hypothetical protein
MTHPSSTVLFDAACPPCRTLATLAARRAGPSLTFCSWQEFRDSDEARARFAGDVLARPADVLRVVADGALIEGESAWAFLLERYRDLAGLGWMAEKLGVTRGAAQSLSRAGRMLRRFCRRCGDR